MIYEAGNLEGQSSIRALADLATFEQSRLRIIAAQDGGRVAFVEHHGLLGQGAPVRLAREEAYLLRVHLKPCAAHGAWLGDERTRCRPLPAGAMVVHDLRRSAGFDIGASTHTLLFQVPTTMAAPSDANGASLIEALAKSGASLVDPVTRDLCMLLPSTMDEAPARPGGFFESLVLALVAHLGHRRVLRDGDPAMVRGGLAPWQEHRAKAILIANLAEEVRIEEVAKACGLSHSQFARAFRHTTGLPPYRWLVHRRVEAARALLPKGDLSLAQVGHECGFADQSHFTRVFSALEGVPPGLWRRRNTTAPYATPVR